MEEVVVEGEKGTDCCCIGFTGEILEEPDCDFTCPL